MEITDDTAATFGTRIWILSHDENELIAQVAQNLWENSEIGPRFRDFLIPELLNPVEDIRESTGRAIAAALEIHPAVTDDTLAAMYAKYEFLSKPPEPKLDEYGMVIKTSIDLVDTSASRNGLLRALFFSAKSISKERHSDFYRFLIDSPCALADPTEVVRQSALSASIAVIDLHGKDNINNLLVLFNEYLDAPTHNAKEHDVVRESVIVSLGALAKHLDRSDSRIPVIIEKLSESLKTPSETVQVAVARCLPPLMTKSLAKPLIEQTLTMTVEGSSLAVRRGGAFGLAGAVKGYGLTAFTECGLLDRLKAAMEDKKNQESREGAMFALETFSHLLGRLFEPYILLFLPNLLSCFGDSSNQVREAALDAAKEVMANMSAHCIKIILPIVLKGLEDYKWRAKVGSVELLGSMAYCAPKQLALSLPLIIPRLSETLTDSHNNVRSAAEAALLKFSSVIENPEIKDLAPTLLRALGDPSQFTMTALTALMDTHFTHYIDGPSLALVTPIVERALKDRSTEIKKKAAHIMGSMASLTDQKDLVPHLNVLVPLLREVLVDPVPDARSISAKALGSIVDRLGEESFPTLVDELLGVLKADTSGVDRQGAAQGLAEVLAGIGTKRLEDVLPEVVSNVSSAKAYEREGFMYLLMFLPATFGERFQPYLETVVPCILRGLADEVDYVREAAMKTGQIVVIRFARSAVDLLLPELENGLFNENWRIRQSSIQLIGDLIYKIAGFSQSSLNALDEQEAEEKDTEHGRKAVIQALGHDRFNSVLAALYIIRSDTNATVRLTSVHVWKNLVQNTPRTMKEILPMMTEIIVRSLGSSHAEKRQVAAAALGDLVNKLGEFAMHEIIPILRQKISFSDELVRQGVCIGLVQIITSTGKHHVEAFQDDMIACIQIALCDSVADVREAAAQAFDALHSQLGVIVVDEILPRLLVELQHSADNGYALEALKELMSVRASVVFPVLIPTLLARPMTAFHAKALGALIKVSGSVISQRISSILTILMDELVSSKSEEVKSQVDGALRTLFENMTSTDALHELMMTLFEWVKETGGKKSVALRILCLFCSGNDQISISVYVGDWIKTTIGLFDSSLCGSAETVRGAWAALDALVKRLKKEELNQYVPLTYRAIQNLISDMQIQGQVHRVEGFNLPKVLKCDASVSSNP